MAFEGGFEKSLRYNPVKADRGGKVSMCSGNHQEFIQLSDMAEKTDWTCIFNVLKGHGEEHTVSDP